MMLSKACPPFHSEARMRGDPARALARRDPRSDVADLRRIDAEIGRASRLWIKRREEGSAAGRYISGMLSMKSASWLASTGTKQDHRQRHEHDQKDEDGQRRAEAAEAPALEPVGHRVERIGEHHAGDERQEDLAEDQQEQEQEQRQALRSRNRPDARQSCERTPPRVVRPSLICANPIDRIDDRRGRASAPATTISASA